MDEYSPAIFLLPNELILHILQYVDYTSCLLFFSTCQRFSSFNDENFWKHQIINRLGMTSYYNMTENDNYKDIYLKLATKKGEYGPGSEAYIKYINIATNFNNVPPLCRNYFINIFDIGAKKNAICNFSEKGNIRGVKLMLSKLANGYNRTINCNMAMVFAALGGHMKIIELMLDLGADDYNRAMAFAAKGGRMDIVNFFLNKGVIIDDLTLDAPRAHFRAYDYNRAMVSAAGEGRMDIVQFMIEKGANNYNLAISVAAEGGHIEIVQLMLEKGANDYNEAMRVATSWGHTDIAELLQKYM